METSRLSKLCPRLEMPRCSPCAINVVGLTMCCKELKGDSDRQLLNRDIVQDIVGWWLSRWTGDAVSVDGWRVESGRVDASDECYLDGHRPLPFPSWTHPRSRSAPIHWQWSAKSTPSSFLEALTKEPPGRSLCCIVMAPFPLYGVTEADDVPSKWNFVISLTPFLSPVKVSRGISSYHYERSYSGYGS
ncbi:hypothetical protein M422DRAFT_254672 [Sphaerobolus stellatus SS14]|uniref:Uncharacterized protein n=1 Tax=Sphaerobolus stellatus (strain SS14) TaxID=990650 RepID=A0A0C9VKQ2_SPHS4|nr:hypothetical protein M422DRAFT_254672 [Sphaerobolus stellatus SS14]